MNNTYPIGTTLSFVWRFQASDGNPVAFTSRYSFVLKYITGRGTDIVDTFIVNADGDGITWTFPASEQVFIGKYSLALDILYDGELLEHCYYRDAFSLYKSANGVMNLTQNERSEVIDLVTVGEFYHFMTGEVINLPDEEDITSGSNNLLKFRDRTPENGMGYVILRRNKSFAEQLTQEDTIYEIRYDFDLDGDAVTIPSGCSLKFDGGSIINGELVFDNTYLDGDVKIDCVCSGTCANDTIYVSWFDSSLGNFKGIDFNHKRILFDTNMTIDDTIYIDYDIDGCEFDGCGHTVTESRSGTNDFLFSIGGGDVKGVKIHGFRYVGAKSDGTPTSSFCSIRANNTTTVDGCEIFGNTIKTIRLGISLDGDQKTTSGCPITNCRIYDNVIDCDQLGMAYETVGFYGVHIPNNQYTKAYRNVITNARRHALYHPYGYDNEIYSNEFSNCPYIAVPVLRDSVNIMVRNNIFENNYRDINVAFLSYDGNWNKHGYTDGIKNIVISDNLFINDRKSRESAIQIGSVMSAEELAAAGRSCNEIKISHNNFDVTTRSTYDTYRYIQVAQGKNFEICNNVFRHTTVGEGLSINVDGINTISSSVTDWTKLENFIITDNIMLFDESIRYAINIQGSYINSGLIRTFIIEGNQFVNRRSSDALNYDAVTNVSGANNIRQKLLRIQDRGQQYRIVPYGTYSPTDTGEYNVVGDIVFSFNANNKPVYYLCTESGNPGTWVANEFDGAAIGVARSGAYSSRPSGSSIYAGFQYFNTDSHKTITYDGSSKWYNPDGTEALS